MYKKKNFFIRHQEQILNVAIILASLFLVFIWLSCENKNHDVTNNKTTITQQVTGGNMNVGE